MQDRDGKQSKVGKTYEGNCVNLIKGESKDQTKNSASTRTVNFHITSRSIHKSPKNVVKTGTYTRHSFSKLTKLKIVFER